VRPRSQSAPNIKLGICGEHGGEPASVKFCHRLGLDYVKLQSVPDPNCSISGSASSARELKRLVTFSGHRGSTQTHCGVRFTIRRVVPSIPLSEITDMEIFCKLDKLASGPEVSRSAARAMQLAQLSPDSRSAASSPLPQGNHAQALAYQGSLLGIPATVVMA